MITAERFVSEEMTDVNIKGLALAVLRVADRLEYLADTNEQIAEQLRAGLVKIAEAIEEKAL